MNCRLLQHEPNVFTGLIILSLLQKFNITEHIT